MAGIEATFVVARTSDSTVNISARSHKTINVQRIMEKMGGGGHFNLAACQLRDCSVAQAKNKLIELLWENWLPRRTKMKLFSYKTLKVKVKKAKLKKYHQVTLKTS